MGLVCPELSLDLKPSYIPQTINAFLREVSFIADASERLDKVDDFVGRLESELNKIEVFKRELPLCMLLLKDAILYLKQELSQYKTRNAHQPVLEEFIPLKKDSMNGETNAQLNKLSEEESRKDKKNWMSSVQLWNTDDIPSMAPHLSRNSNQNQSQTFVLESPKGDEKRGQIVGGDLYDPCKIRAGAGSKGFVPLVHSYPTTTTTTTTSTAAFPELRKVDKEDVSVSGLTLLVPGMIKHSKEESISRAFNPKLGGARVSNSSSPASTGRPSHQQPSSRKQRRCWSPELHRRFVDALTQLGGPQVATPKQIRELMRVDGLTNDEVKSHLQKYRLHTRRVPNDSGASGNKNGQGLSGSWTAQDQYSESSKPSSSQSASPEGPLQFPGLTGGTSTTGGDSMDDEDDEKSESYGWNAQRAGKDDV